MIVDARPRWALSREAWYAGLFSLGLANTIFPLAAEAVTLHGLATATAGLFGVSALVWAAIGAIWLILREGTSGPIDRTDLALGLLVATACLLPPRVFAGAATSLAALMMLARSEGGTPLFRASAVVAATMTALLWGRVLLDISGTRLLDLDVWLASHAGGLRSAGNQLFAAGSAPVREGFIVAPGCSSLHGVSMALLGWALVTQTFALRADARNLALCLLSIVAIVALNVTRLAAFAYYPSDYDWLHSGTGAALFGAAATAFVFLFNFAGNWRAIVAAR